jgi:hypothetical protein
MGRQYLMDLEGTEWENVDLVLLAQDRYRWRAVVKTAFALS